MNNNSSKSNVVAAEDMDNKKKVNYSEKGLFKNFEIESILGDDIKMCGVRNQIKQYAQTDSTVLIEGESGTGKELVAKALHYSGRRKEQNFVVIDCTSIPVNLIESTLFGHEKGAFTDAKQRIIGKFEEADKGTIFLDEISEIPVEFQSKLLRVIQEKEFYRICGNESVRVDVRVIAATNRDLTEMIGKNQFRKDLYYRLNVLNICLPPLKEHINDIEIYAKHFIKKYAESLGKDVLGITEEAVDILKRYNWEGNVRELENVIQKAILNSNSNYIRPKDMKFLKEEVSRKVGEGLSEYILNIRRKAEREIIIKVLNETNWKKEIAAQKLKINRRTLFNKIKELGIENNLNMK